MSAGHIFVAVILALGFLSPFLCLASYCFGWWWRGRADKGCTNAPKMEQGDEADQAAEP